VEGSYLIGGMAWNAGLFAVAVFFIKRWMNAMEVKANVNAENIAKQSDWTSKELAKFTATTTEDIKDVIRENRAEYNRRSDSIIQSIDKLSDHMAIANGRTSKLEGRLETQIRICEERQRRQAARCS
jgi:gas vesicle protein